jgi:hypothetical protein
VSLPDKDEEPDELADTELDKESETAVSVAVIGEVAVIGGGDAKIAERVKVVREKMAVVASVDKIEEDRVVRDVRVIEFGASASGSVAIVARFLREERGRRGGEVADIEVIVKEPVNVLLPLNVPETVAKTPVRVPVYF